MEIRSKIKTLVPSVNLRELDTACIIQAEESSKLSGTGIPNQGKDGSVRKFYNGGARRFFKGIEGFWDCEKVGEHSDKRSNTKSVKLN